jgi:hypothetical protein
MYSLTRLLNPLVLHHFLQRRSLGIRTRSEAVTTNNATTHKEQATRLLLLANRYTR